MELGKTQPNLYHSWDVSWIMSPTFSEHTHARMHTQACPHISTISTFLFLFFLIMLILFRLSYYVTYMTSFDTVLVFSIWAEQFLNLKLTLLSWYQKNSQRQLKYLIKTFQKQLQAIHKQIMLHVNFLNNRSILKTNFNTSVCLSKH